MISIRELKYQLYWKIEIIQRIHNKVSVSSSIHMALTNKNMQAYILMIRSRSYNLLDLVELYNLKREN